MSGNLLGSPRIWNLGTKNKWQETFWALQKREFWALTTNVRKPSGLSKNMSFGHRKQMSGNLLGSPKTWVWGTKNKCQETFWALQKREFWAPKTNVRKPSGLSKNMNFGYQKQMSGNLLDSPKTWVLGTKNKCQEIFWALQKHEFWAPKTNVRKPSGHSKNMSFGHQKKETFWTIQNHEFWAPKTNGRKPSGPPKTWVLGTKNECQEILWALQNMSCGHQKQISGYLLGSPKTWVLGTKNKMSGNLLGSPKTWVLGTKNKCQQTFWALQKHEFWAPNTNVSKPSGLSKNMNFGHQKQMSGNLLGYPKTWVLGTKHKCQQTFWALQKHEFWAPKTNVRKPSGLSKNMSFGHQKQMSGNLVGSPKTWDLGTNNKCQEAFWALQKHEFWAPRTNVRKPSGLSKNMSFGHQKQMSGNLLGSPKTWVWAPKANVRKPFGLSKNMNSGHQKKRETFWTIQKHEFWAPITNIRKPSGLSKKHEVWAPKTNVRKPSGLSKNMSFGHQKQMSRNLLGSPKISVLGTKNKCQ